MIADSSVLIVFARSQRLEVLLRTVGEVAITAAVRQECVDAAPHRPDAAALSAALGARRVVEIPSNARRLAAVRRRYPNLGAGEASVLAAALERGEPAVLLDEAPARRAAALEGLEPVGSLGVLARAHRQGVLPEKQQQLAEAVRDLVAAGLWVAPEVVEAFWLGLGGRRQGRCNGNSRLTPRRRSAGGRRS